MNRGKHFGFSLVGFLLFFATIAITSLSAVLVFNYINIASNGNKVAIGFAIFACVLVGALLCTIADILRRKYMIEEPVTRILEATKKMASGNFKSRLIIKHSYDKFDEYDLIMQNLNILAEELSKNEILKTDFISNVSHEIKTPLSIIQIYATSLKKQKLAEETKKQYLNTLVQTSKKLTSLINNILTLSKLENQKILPSLEKVDVGEILTGCVLGFEELIEKKKLNLKCDINSSTLTTCVPYLEIAFNNLISNAIKFTGEGGNIKVTLKNTAKYAVITVKDSGCGIPPEVGKRIFDKFYQADTSHSGEGNGLGLALVKRVIDVLGGEVSVESKLGEGSIFCIKLKK